MTLEAVHSIIGRGVVSDDFRRELVSGKMTREEIAAAVAGLDDHDVTATRIAVLMNVGNFVGLSSEMDLYINRRYSPGTAATGDDLPISV